MPVPSPFSMNFNDHQDMTKARSWSFHILSALRKNRNSYLKLAFSMRSLRTSPHQFSFFFFFCFFFPLENFSLAWKRPPSRWRTYIRTRDHWAVRVLLRATPTVTRAIHAYCRSFGRGAVTTCFNDLGLSRPRIELQSPTRRANSLPNEEQV